MFAEASGATATTTSTTAAVAKLGLTNWNQSNVVLLAPLPAMSLGKYFVTLRVRETASPAYGCVPEFHVDMFHRGK